jgi:YD repeat-containing protein
MFKFSVAGDLTPALTMTDAVGQKDNYTWQPNGYILSDNDWKYRIGPQIANSNLPSLSRTNTQGQTESISIATRTGTIIETNLQGVITTTKVFRTPGPYFNKVREITQTSNGVTQVLERRSYDQAGRLIRSMDQSGTVTTYTYDSAGKLARQANSVDPQVFAELQKEEAAMLKAIAATTDVGQKNALLENLGLFYVHQMKDDKKASALVAAITDPFAAYTLRTHAIAYDGDLTSQQKITEYQKLLAQYPNQRAFTDSLIAIAQDHPTGE